MDSSPGPSAVWPEVRFVTSLSLSKTGAKLIASYRTAVVLKWDNIGAVPGTQWLFMNGSDSYILWKSRCRLLDVSNDILELFEN